MLLCVMSKNESVNTLADMEKLQVLQLDVTDDKSVDDAILSVTSEAGR